ncbi:restriction endonuclease subunit S [Tolypothrix sp. VBCCA 56010]|uniref:restriction endonuclease subunit S n=1 Tax=Tolypothrix sp. VBCCA 56010 TaxID=3137731 RepID=UPI003D7D7B3B
MAELPEGWMWAKLGELGLFINGDRGKNYPNKNALAESGIPFINAGHIQDGIIKLSEMNYITEERFNLLGSGKVKSNDILYCLRGSLGKTAIVKNITTGAIASSLVIIRPFDCSKHEYLFYYLISPFGDAEIRKYDNGSAQPNLAANSVRSYSVPLPPLNEQRRIVAKIEALSARSQRVKEALEDIPQLLDQFRQSVLAAAFRGDLTADWREQNPDVEPASELLDKIYKQRLKIYQEECKKFDKQGNKRIQKTRKFQLIDKTNYDIPDTWELSYPEYLCSPDEYSIGIGPFGSNLKVSDYTDKGVPLVFVRNIRSGNFESLEPKYISHEKAQELLPHIVKPLDLLITKMGDPPGDCEIYPEHRPEAVITSDCLKFRVWGFFLDRNYFKHCINSSFIKHQLGLITRGVAQQKISLERFKSILIPVAPQSEQKEIIKRVDSLLEVASQIEASYQQVITYLDQLDQSILAKAFRGELVPQDPNDEPASVLLERIRAERDKLQTKTAKKSTTKTSTRRTKKTQQQEEESVQLELGLE